MPNLPDTDKQFLDEAWERMLRSAGIREHAFAWKLSDLIDQGSDTNPTYGIVTVDGLIVTTGLNVTGYLAIRTTTSTGAILNSDSTVLADASLTPISLTLPTAVGVAGRVYTIKKIDNSGNALSVITTSGQTIDGAASLTVTSQWVSVTVQSDGSNWLIL